MQNTAICICYVSYVGTMNKDLNGPSSFNVNYMRAGCKNQPAYKEYITPEK
jgi:hypothetical protein